MRKFYRWKTYRGEGENAGPFQTREAVDAAIARLRTECADIPDDEWAETVRDMLAVDEYPVEFWLTTAPEAFDGFGTFTVGGVPLPADAPENARAVAIEVRHVEWQTLRYGSGLFAARQFEPGVAR